MKVDKRYLILFFIAVLFTYNVSSVVVGGTYYSDAPNIVVNLLNYGDNNELTPGIVEDFKFKFENIASVDAQDVSFEIVTNFPFDASRTGYDNNSLGSMSAFQDGDDALIENYKVYISPDAATGSYDMIIRVYLKGKLSYEKKYSVNVRTTSSTLLLNNIVTNPEIVVPGNSVTLAFDLENNDNSAVKNVNVKLDLSSETLPFSVLQTGSEIEVNSINSNNNKKFEFNLVSFNDASPGYYKVPLIITYEDENTMSYTKNELIPFVLGDEAKLSYFIDKDDNFRFNEENRLSINLVNRGLTEIKFIEVEINTEKLKKQGVNLLSSHRYYVGNLDSDEATSADFDIKIKDINNIVESININELNLEIPITIVYSDFLNREKRIEDTLYLDLSKDTLVSNMQKQGNSSIIILAVVMIVIVIFFMRRHKNKKHN